MKPGACDQESQNGWEWFESEDDGGSAPEDDALHRSFARCFNSADGELVLGHLRRTILDRRLGPESSDAELRFLEGQRSVVAQVLSMLAQGRSR